MLNLFSPLTLSQARLPNRIVLTALPSGHAAPAGFVSHALAAYYLERACSGLGMLIFEHTYALPPPDSVIPHLGLYADAQVPDLRQCIEAARREGPAVLVMLDQPLSLASLSRAEIAEVGEAFIAAAWRARAAGANGVMLSAADGGPFEQLVSPLQNRRSDRYGGGTAGRLRLLLDVVEGIQKWLGEQFVIGVRLNVAEFAPGGLTLQDARVIAKRLIAVGVRLLEVSAEASANVPIARFPGWHVPLAAGIKAVVDVPVLVGELSDDPGLADSVIREGSADLVALGETLRAEPLWPHRAWAALAVGDGATAAPTER